MNFPAGVKRNKTNLNLHDEQPKRVWKANMANKGMTLEEMVNNSNLYYLNSDIAVIHKKPIPIQIVKVSYPSRNKAVITEAYYKTPSTTDYNGIYKGLYIDFDAKECSSLTSFTLKNVHEHQFKHLQNIKRHGGIGFFLVAWNKYEKYYILEIDQYMKFYEESLNNGRKSIPYDYFKQNCIEVYQGYKPELDYLKGIDELIKTK